MHSVSKIMVKDVITIHPGDSLDKAQKLLEKHGITRLVVVEEGNRPVGILTARDIVNKLIEDETMRVTYEIPVSEAMTKNPIKIEKSESIKNASKIMLNKGISSLIITEGEKLMGIVTKTDISKYYAENYPGRFKVKEIMTHKVYTVRPSHSIFIAAKLMNEHNIGRVVVVKENKPIGILTVFDLAAAAMLLTPARLTRFKEPLTYKGVFLKPSPVVPFLLTVRDLMTADPIVVDEEEDSTIPAKLIVSHKISGLPVVNGKGELTGIVTKTDLTRVIAEKSS